MRDIHSRWEQFWFEPVRPATLGFCRVLFFLGVILFNAFDDLTLWSWVPREFYQPIWLFRLLHLHVLSLDWMRAIELIWGLSLLLSCIGLLTRPSIFVSLTLGIYTLGLPNNFGKVGHGNPALIFTMVILLLARSGDAWSIDSLIRRARGKPNRDESSGEYTWPIKMAWVMLSIIFCAAGITKLRRSGLAWITSDNLSIVLMQHHYALAEPVTTVGLWLSRVGWLCKVLAGAAVLLEISFPIAMISAKLRKYIVPAAFLFQFGIGLIMGVYFVQFLLLYLFWIPWDRVGFWMRAKYGSRNRYAVLFDGGCGLCSRTVAILRRLDLLDRLEYLDIGRNWPTLHQRYPQLDEQAVLTDMHVISPANQITKGFDGYRSICWLLPLGWLVLPLLYLPPVPAIGRRVYEIVAARRATTSCALPRTEIP